MLSLCTIFGSACGQQSPESTVGLKFSGEDATPDRLHQLQFRVPSLGFLPVIGRVFFIIPNKQGAPRPRLLLSPASTTWYLPSS